MEFSTIAPSNTVSRGLSTTNFAAKINNVKGLTGSGNDIGYVVMRPTGMISGRVMLYGADSSEGILVTADGTSYSAVSGSDGSYSIQNLPEGTYTISFTKDKYIPYVSDEITIIASDELESPVIPFGDVFLLSVDNSSVIKGFASYKDKTNNSGITITVLDAQGKAISQMQSDENGAFSFTNLPSGTYVVKASAYEYDVVSTEIIINERQTYETTLSPLPSIYGTITVHTSLEGKTDFSGMTVSLFNGDSFIESKQTPENGIVMFSNVWKGTNYIIKVECPDYFPNEKSGISVACETDTSVSADMLKYRFGSISGAVRDTSGAPIKDVVVELIRELDDSLISSVVTDDKGLFSINKLEAGKYCINYSKDEFVSKSQTDIGIAAGENKTVEPTVLKSVYGSLVVNAKLDAGTDFSWITVSLFDSNNNFIESLISPSNGVVTFSKLHYGNNYKLLIESEDYYPQEKVGIAVLSETTTNVSTSALVYKYGSVNGKVIDNALQSIGGATVALVSNDDTEITYSMTTDSSGEFLNEKVLEGTYTATVMAHKYSPMTILSPVVVKSRQSTNTGTTKLTPVYGTVSGTVSYKDKDNPKDISVIMVNEEGNAVLSVTTTETGAFSVSELYPGTYTVTASAPNYASREMDIVVAAGITSSVTLEPLSSVLGGMYGTVSDKSGENLSGALVLLVSVEDASRRYTVSTGSDGSFRIGSLEAGLYTVTVSLQGYGTEVLDQSIAIIPNGETAIGNIKLTLSTASVFGTVSFADKVDCSKITITLLNSEGTAVDSLITAENGQFAFGNVQPGSYTINASSSGYGDSSVAIAVAAGENYEVNLAALKTIYGVIEGKIVLNDGGSPKGIQITISRSGKILSTLSDIDGLFSFDGLDAGTYSLTMEKTGYSLMATEVIVEEGQITHLTSKTLESLYGSIEIHVSYEDKNPDDGIKVSVFKGGSLIKTVASDISGTILLNGLEIGSHYSVRAESSKYISTTKESISVLSNKTTEVVMDSLKLRYASINGSTSLEDGLSTSGILIQMKDKEGHVIDSKETDSKGLFSFVDVEPGTYTVTASKAGYSLSSKEVTVIAGGSYNVTIDSLKSLYGIISGSVVLEESSDHAGVIVTAIGEHTYTATTISDGSFIMSEVEPGSYTFSYQKDGFITKADDTGTVVEAGATVSAGVVRMSSRYCVVSGFVGYSDKMDKAGITVVIKDMDGIVIETTETTPTGTFEFSGLDAGTYTIDVSSTGYITRTKEILMTAGKAYVVSIDSLINACGSIVGTVVLSGNSDYSNVSVRAFNATNSYNATSTSDGSFAINNVEPGIYSVTYSINGYVSKTISNVEVEEGTRRTIEEISLSSSLGSIKVIAKYADASDASGITVSLYDNDEFVSNAVTGLNGIVTFDNVSVGNGYTIVAENENYYPKKRSGISVLSETETNVVVDSLMYRFGSVFGSVVNNAHELISGATVVLVSYEDSNTSFTLTSGTDGQFQSDRIDTGVYSVTVMAQNHSNVTLTEAISVGSRQTVNIGTVRLTPIYGTVTGSVGYADRTNPKDIAVVISNSGNVSVDSVITTETGLFSMTDVVPGTYTVTATADGYASVSRSVTVSAGQNYIVELGYLTSVYGSINGKVTLNGGTDHSGITVTAESSSHTYYASTNASGVYTIVNVEPGTYTLGYSKTGYVSDTDNVIVVAGEQTNGANVTLSVNLGAIAGKVVLEGKSNNSGITVSARTASEPNIIHSATTVEDGSFYIGNLKAGEYTVSVAMDGFFSDSVTAATVTYGATTNVSSITMRSVAAKVMGTVTLSGAADHTGTQVLLQNADTSLSYNTTTNQSGEFVLSQVMPGTYTVFLSKTGYESKSVSGVYVTQATDLNLDALQLQVAVRSVTGNVSLELRTDHSGALITATNLADSTKVYSAISNSAGDYTLAGMIPGEYSIVISHAGFRSLTLPTINVIDGTTLTIDPEMIEINRGTISGVVTLKGRANSEGIKVELLQGNTIAGTLYSDAAGEYSFYVPQGNYSGVRMSFEDYRTETVSSSIALFADNFISIDNTELQATANTVYGTVDVLTTDNESDVTIIFDGHDEITAFTTDANGAFRFEHVPIGNYTMRFRRDNCSDIVVPVNVIAADGINLGCVTVTPNTATIKGKVNLANGGNLSGVLVTVDMGAGTVTGYTDASGRYEIGGISVADVYTVIYSKAGWESDTQQISPKLEKLEIREMDEMTLVDTTNPVLNGVVINSGANNAADRHVTLHFTTTEQGSGVATVMITYDNIFDRTVTRHDYLANMDWELPSGNGEKTIYVKVVDAAGNESNTVSARVTLTDQKKEVSGVLTGDDLHWTEEQSPYLVVGNIMVEEDKTLIIDPGVDVQFAGEYYVQVEGTISAVGTEEKRISFYGVDEGVDNWKGIKGVSKTGSILDYVSIEGLSKGIQGYISVWNSCIVAADYSLGGSDNNTFYLGDLRNSSVNGKIRASEASFFSSTISTDSATITKSFITGSTVSGDTITLSRGLVENSMFTNANVYSSKTGTVNVSFDNCSVWLGNGGTYYSCEFIGCSFIDGYDVTDNYHPLKSLSPAIIRNSNLIDCTTMSFDELRANTTEIDLRGNFWGYDKTREMNENGVDSNLSFIVDYYDDFNVVKAVLDDYKTDVLEGVGYIGVAYYGELTESPVEYSIGEIGPAGGYVFYDKGFYSEGWRYLEIAPSNIEMSIFGYYRVSDDSDNYCEGTAWAIGSGRINTWLLVETMGATAYTSSEGSTKTSNYAANVCYTYEVDSYADWFLPSWAEMAQAYEKLHNNGIGDFSIGDFQKGYWTSSVADKGFANVMDFSDGELNAYNSRQFSQYVRPIRAF